MRILGIETSCDETSVALLEASRATLKLHRHVIASQVALHSRYGGVVPEVAARKHSETLPRMLAKVIGKKLLKTVDVIAVTAGPGLITSLMVGVQTAKTLSQLTHIPLVGVNHLEGHIYATWLDSPDLYRNPEKYFPSLVLIVSGGHTELVLMTGHGRYTPVGQTLDDAAGEAFDKVAKILNLGYPGGPIISRIARNGNPAAIDFPRPLSAAAGYDMSFSGLKTAALYYLEKRKKISKKEIPDIAASFQQAVIDAVMIKVRRAAKRMQPRSLMVCGGVSANPLLRTTLSEFGKKMQIPVLMPAFEFTGDNAAMIAVAGYYRRKEASTAAWRILQADPQLPLRSYA